MTIGPFQNQAHRRDAPAYRQAPIKRENAKVDRQVPLDPALEGGVKGHSIRGNYLTGKPRSLGRVASLFFSFPHLFSCRSFERQEKNLISLRSLHSLRLCGADLIWTRMVFGIFANYVTLDRVPSCVYFFIGKCL